MSAVKAIEELLQEHLEVCGGADTEPTLAAVIGHLREWDKFAAVMDQLHASPQGRTILAGTFYEGGMVAALVVDRKRSEPPVSHDLAVYRMVKLPAGVKLRDVAAGMGGWSRKAGSMRWGS